MQPGQQGSPLPPEGTADEDVMEPGGDAATGREPGSPLGREPGSPLQPDQDEGEDVLRPEAHGTGPASTPEEQHPS